MQVFVKYKRRRSAAVNRNNHRRKHNSPDKPSARELVLCHYVRRHTSGGKAYCGAGDRQPQRIDKHRDRVLIVYPQYFKRFDVVGKQPFRRKPHYAFHIFVLGFERVFEHPHERSDKGRRVQREHDEEYNRAYAPSEAARRSEFLPAFTDCSSAFIDNTSEFDIFINPPEQIFGGYGNRSDDERH